jgi:hypothetical protein
VDEETAGVAGREVALFGDVEAVFAEEAQGHQPMPVGPDTDDGHAVRSRATVDRARDTPAPRSAGPARPWLPMQAGRDAVQHGAETRTRG